jgi:hypothetical protein
MRTGSNTDEIAEWEAHDEKVARVGFIVLLLLILMAIAVWIGIAAWFLGHRFQIW